MVNERQETKEGVEINFATNTLGTFYLTTSLLDVLEKSKPSRVVQFILIYFILKNFLILFYQR